MSDNDKTSARLTSPYTRESVNAFVGERFNDVQNTAGMWGDIAEGKPTTAATEAMSTMRSRFVSFIGSMPRPFQVMLMESDNARFISTGSAESVGHYARSIGGEYTPGEGFAFTGTGEIIWNNASAENAARIVSHELVHQFDAELGRSAGSQGFLSENGGWLEAVRRDYELSQQNQGNRVAMYDDEDRTVFDRIMSETDMRIRAREALAEMGSHHMIMRASGLSDVEIDAKMRWTYPNMWESYEKNFLPFTEQHAAQLLERRNTITEGYVKSEHALAEAKGLPWGPEQENVARARAAEIHTSRMESNRIYNWQQADIAQGTVPLASSEVDKTTTDLPKTEAQPWGRATEGPQPATATPDTAPRPALSAEPAGWLARDLTWGAATQDHLSHWFKEVNYNAWHDPSHVILALSGMPKFQATFDAEIHALTIDDALARPNPESNFDPSVLATEEGYRASVKNVAEIFGAEENLTRTLLWSMAGESGQTTDDLYRSYDHDRSELRFDAKNHGIIMDAEYNGARETISAWKIRLPNGSHYTFDSNDPSKTNLPSGSNGVEDFTPFRAPSDEQISNIFRRVEPILKDLQPQIAAAAAADPSGNKAEWLSGIKVRDMHARMYGGTDAPLTISAAVPRVSAILDAPELSAKPGTDSAAPLAAEIEKRNIQTDPETGKKIYTPRNGEDVSAAVARARIYANASGEDVTATHNRATFTITPGMTQEEGLAGWQADKAFRASPEFRDSPVGIEERNISRHPVTGKLTYNPSPGEHIDDSARRALIFVNDSGKQVIVDHSYGRSVVAPVAALNAATPDSRAPAADASPVDALRPVSTPELPRATAVEMSATELDAAREAAAGDKLLGRAGTKLPPGAIRMQNLMRQAAQNGAAAGASPNTETPSSTPDAVPSASPATASAEVAHAAPVAPPTPTPATAPVPVPAPVAPTTPSSGNTAQTSTPSTTTVAVEAAVAATIVTSAQADSVTPPLTEPTHSKAMNKGMSGLGLGMATNMVKEINRKLEAGETVSVEEYVAAGVNMGSGALDLAGKGLDSLAGAKMGAIKGGALVQTALALPMILAAARTGDSTQIGAVSVGAVSGIGFGLAGQTFIPIPGVGFVIGVVAGEAGAKLGGLATTAMLNDDPAMRAQAQNELKNLAIEYGTPPGVGLNLAGAAVSSVGRAVNTLGQVSTWLGDKVDDLNALTGRNLVTGPVLGGASLVLKGTGVVVSGLGNAVDAVGQASEAVGHGVNRATKEMIRGVGSAVNHFGQSLTQEYQRDPTVRGALKATVVASADVVQRTVDYAERRLQETGQAVVNAVSNAQSWYANNAPSWLGGKGEKTPEKHPTPHPSYNAQITGLIAEAKAKGRAGELDANHDGTFDMNDIRAHLKKSGMKLDANQDGVITGGEFIRAQTTPAKPAQAAAVQGHR